MNILESNVRTGISGSIVETDEGKYLIIAQQLEPSRTNVRVYARDTHEGLFACELELPYNLIERLSFEALELMKGNDAYI